MTSKKARTGYNSRTKFIKKTLPAAMVLISCQSTLQAQEVAQEERQSRNRMMEEVVVTATKRAENAQDVPVSVSAFSGDMLAAMGVDNPTDLQAVTPGLTYNSATGFSIIYLRGVGSDAFLMADPSVATYIDGIYYPFASGLAQSFGKVERIEVLKGPQGTLFGRNTTGGAISITTEQPSFDEVYGSIDASYGSFNARQTAALINVPVTDWFATSLALFYNESDQYYTFDPESKQQNMDVERAAGGRFKMKFASEHFDLLLAAVKVKQSGYNTALAANTRASDQAKLQGAESQPRDHTISVDAPLNFDIDSEVLFGEFNAYLDHFDIKLLASHQTLENYGQSDFDGTNASIIAFQAPLFADVKTAELQFISNQDSWNADWLEWIGGLYYINSTAGLLPRFGAAGGEQGNIGPIPIGSLLGDLTQQLPAPALNGIALNLEGILDTDSWAAFFQTTFTLTDWAELTLGGRYQYEERYVVASSTSVENADGSSTLLFDWANDGQGVREVDGDNFSPKIAVNLRPAEDLLVFLSWQKGFKSGTFNTVNITDDIDYAEEEQVTSYELGAKYTSPSGNFVINSAVFYTEIDNIQVQFSSIQSGGAVTFDNAGAGRIQGIDFDSKIVLIPTIVDDFILSVSGAYLDAIYTDYTDGLGFDEDSGAYQDGQDFTGNRMVRTPEYTATMALSKTFLFDDGPLEITADAYYNSGYAYLPQNTVFMEEEYYLVNARASFLIEDWDLRITASGKNLSDTVYAYSQFPNDDGRLEALAPPRNYSLAVQWNF
ncbi:TonB-dependent receptor [Zhongshania guokunii]|uniref:TonB-dependent receptor n=1 Tax=Zhongshania guokunii TaxID=641783 RepID=A0ABV3U3A0_9GAMM|tara:strand:+ start:13665 stop:15995 length:2331 start_codon:yes stop_codon:yes gene_type:complete